MGRFLTATGITVAVTLVCTLLLTGLTFTGSAILAVLELSGAACVGIAIGGGLFYLLKRFLSVRWYTRLPCALLSGWLSVNVFFGAIELGAGRIASVEEIPWALAFLAFVIGVLFGAGLGQSAREA